MNTRAVNIYLSLYLFVSFSVFGQNVKLCFPDYRWEHDHTCWAAICQSTLEYYKKYKSQDQIIQYASGGLYVVNYMCNKNNPKSIDKILLNLGDIQSNNCYGTTISLPMILTETDHDRPIIILDSYWCGPPFNVWDDEGIFIAIIGYQPNSPEYYLWYEDPYPDSPDDIIGGKHLKPNSWVMYHLAYHDNDAGCDVYEKWKETLTLSTNPPYNSGNIGTISAKGIPAILSAIFQVLLKKVP
jgi:hypothetical protein